jgi:hypothetical protein
MKRKIRMKIKRPSVEQSSKHHPNNVISSNGECEEDGYYTPHDNHGKVKGKSKYFKTGESFPNDGWQWLRTG